jgi:hypothetical protein
MFGFWMFFIHHIYTAILVSVEEENGLMDSIFSGYKFVPKQELLRDPAVEEQQPDVETVQAVAVEEEESHTAVCLAPLWLLPRNGGSREPPPVYSAIDAQDSRYRP